MNEQTKQLMELAWDKAGQLKPHQQIRLTEKEASYWVFNVLGKIYIGYYLNGQHGEKEMPPFFQDKQEFEMRNKENKLVARLQYLA